MNLIDRSEVEQISYSKNDRKADAPLIAVKLAEGIENPTDTEARRLQRTLKQKGWACYGAEKRRGNLYVQYVPAGAI